MQTVLSVSRQHVCTPSPPAKRPTSGPQAVGAQGAGTHSQVPVHQVNRNSLALLPAPQNKGGNSRRAGIQTHISFPEETARRNPCSPRHYPRTLPNYCTTSSSTTLQIHNQQQRRIQSPELELRVAWHVLGAAHLAGDIDAHAALLLSTLDPGAM